MAGELKSPFARSIFPVKIVFSKFPLKLYTTPSEPLADSFPSEKGSTAKVLKGAAKAGI